MKTNHLLDLFAFALFCIAGYLRYLLYLDGLAIRWGIELTTVFGFVFLVALNWYIRTAHPMERVSNGRQSKGGIL